MNYSERVFWWDTAAMPEGDPAPLPEKVDVAVIGSGFSGCGPLKPDFGLSGSIRVS